MKIALFRPDYSTLIHFSGHFNSYGFKELVTLILKSTLSSRGSDFFKPCDEAQSSPAAGPNPPAFKSYPAPQFTGLLSALLFNPCKG